MAIGFKSTESIPDRSLTISTRMNHEDVVEGGGRITIHTKQHLCWECLPGLLRPNLQILERKVHYVTFQSVR